MKSKCIVFTAPHKVELGELEMPKPGKGQMITKTLFTGVSTGTESRVLRGGEVDTFPLVPGYENVGQVVETGEGVNAKIGDIVYVGSSEFCEPYTKCWAAQVEYALVNENNIIPVPKRTAPEAAIYAKVGGIALHGINNARVNEKDTVAVVGLGLIGHLAAQSAKAKGATVLAIDLNKERLQIAKKAGFDHVLDASEGNIEERVKELTNGGVSVAVDVTGLSHTVNQTAQLVYCKGWTPPFPPSPRVVLLGSYSEPVSFTYHPTLFANEPLIVTSRDTTMQDMQEMMQLIADAKVDPSVLPAKSYPVDDAPQAYKDLVEQKLMRILFNWQ